MNNGRRCPSCNHTKLDVIESSPTFNNTARRIRRRCTNCQHKWTVYEVTQDQIDEFRRHEQLLNQLRQFLNAESTARRCYQCQQWVNAQCSLTIPEAGGDFAEDCAYFFSS